jgi:hypothetical protein
MQIMKNLGITTLMFTTIILFSCEKSTEKLAESDIFYRTLHKEYVMITDIELLQQSNDEVSLHVDSILSGLINAEFISSGLRRFDLNMDNIPDIAFEIIDLNPLNPHGLPANFDTLAAKMYTLNLEVHDNSTWGYVSALEAGELINATGNWDNKDGILGTFGNAGQFQGKGERFLAIRLPVANGYNYGWIRIYCSQHSDTLRIIDYAYNNAVNAAILAGQFE